MKFGAFEQLAVPRPWDPGKEASYYWRDLEIMVACDAAGYDYVWAPEHHFLEEYSHCPNSDTFLTALAMKTERIRLVTGIMNLCPPINHPIKVAERIAMIDIFSKGRVDLGTGRGSGSLENNGFGVSNDVSREMWSEAIEAIPRMWQDDDFSWDGKFFQIPERNVLPKPVQKPHPPLWVTGANWSTAKLAGEKGLGLAIFSFAPPEALAVPINAYREGIAVAQPVGAFINDQVMSVQVCLCLEDGELARKIYRQNIGDYMPYFKTYFDTVVPNDEAKNGPLTQSRYRELIAEAKRTGADAVATYDAVPDVLTRDYMIENGLAVGDPDDIIAVVNRYEAAGIDQIVLSPICGNTQPLDVTFQSIENVGKFVIPRFR